MKNLLKNLFQLLFVTLMLASCSQQDELVVEASQTEVKTVLNDTLLSERAISPYLRNFRDYTGKVQRYNFNVRGNKAKLLELREVIAYYRMYSRVYSYYANKKEKNSNADLTLADLKKIRALTFYLRGSGTSKAYRAKLLIAAVKDIYKSSGVNRWNKINQHIVNMTKIGISTKYIIKTSNAWDGSSSKHGTYTIFFTDNNKTYVGKGGGVRRMRSSAIKWCKEAKNKGIIRNGKSGEFQNTSKLYIDKGYINNSNLTKTDARRQAFKEEAIKMHWLGYASNNSNLLNKANSPGKSYIINDGF